MAWEVWWALILGFTLSGIVQAWVPRARLQRALGGAGGRQIALAEFVGGIVLIALMWLGVRLFVTRRLEAEARAHAEAAQAGHQHASTESGPKLFSVDAWSAVAHNFRGDVEMLWKEILAGF